MNILSPDVKVSLLNPLLASWGGNDRRRQSVSPPRLCCLVADVAVSTEGPGPCLRDGCLYDRSPVPWLLCGTDITEGVSLGHGLPLTACLAIVFESLPFSLFSPHDKNHKQVRLWGRIRSPHYKRYVRITTRKSQCDYLVTTTWSTVKKNTYTYTYCKLY